MIIIHVCCQYMLTCEDLTIHGLPCGSLHLHRRLQKQQSWLPLTISHPIKMYVHNTRPFSNVRAWINIGAMQAQHEFGKRISGQEFPNWCGVGDKLINSMRAGRSLWSQAVTGTKQLTWTLYIQNVRERANQRKPFHKSLWECSPL